MKYIIHIRSLFGLCIIFILIANCKPETNIASSPVTNRPPVIRSPDQSKSLYLAPRHLERLEQQGMKSEKVAWQLYQYYTIYARDDLQSAAWKKRATELSDAAKSDVHDSPTSATESNDSSQALTRLDAELYQILTAKSRVGDEKSARQLAEFYWHKDNDLNAALVWMRRAADLGDVEAESYVFRLEVAIGLHD